uniref:Uncharacterized protein n=1 Tax=Phlebotomus papatasi TaxID=29031 RepID=A0A1B0GM51_PHLPP
MIQHAQAMICEDPRLSIRKMVSILEVSDHMMRNIVEEDLCYKSYTLKKKTDALRRHQRARVKRVERCKKLSSSLKQQAAGRIRFFSDEKMFTVGRCENQS